MSMNEMVSVIIPIYKVENYLDECIQSIVAQTYKNIEIILVDDGSPDRCPQLCDKWAEKDNRIRVIHQKNGGLSVARNSGLKVAAGKYILYVDSDDYLKTEAVERLVSVAENNNAEIVATSYSLTENENASSPRLSGEIYIGNGEEMLAVAIQKWLWQAWGKLIVRSLASQYEFIPQLIYEDYENTPKVFLNAQKVVMLMEGLYKYRIRQDSIMGQRQEVPDVAVLEIEDKNLLLIESQVQNEDLKNQMYKAIIWNAMFRYKQTSKAENCEKKKTYIAETRNLIEKHKYKWLKNPTMEFKKKAACLGLLYFPELFNVMLDLMK